MLTNAPDVIVAGCQQSYAHKFVFSDQEQKQGVKLIAVPRFSATQSIVLLDCSSLVSYELAFGASDTQTNSMEVE